MSQISSVFDCLLEEEECSLKENPVDSVQWAEVVVTINNIIKVQLIYYFMEADVFSPKRDDSRTNINLKKHLCLFGKVK